MDNREIGKLWRKYNKELIKSSLLDSIPDKFNSPRCGTCTHWRLLTEDDLSNIDDEKEYKEIIRGMKGELAETVTLSDGSGDYFYYSHFYGYCKRFPPYFREEIKTYNLKSLLGFMSSNIRNVINRNSFPITHDGEECGEWKQSEFSKQLISKHLKDNDKSDS